MNPTQKIMAAWARMQPSASFNYNEGEISIELVFTDGNDVTQHVFEHIPVAQALEMFAQFPEAPCHINWNECDRERFAFVTGIEYMRSANRKRQRAIDYQVYASVRYMESLAYIGRDAWAERNAVFMQEQAAIAYRNARRMLGMEE